MPNTLNVDTTSLEKGTFRDPVLTFKGPIQRSMTIHCDPIQDTLQTHPEYR